MRTLWAIAAIVAVVVVMAILRATPSGSSGVSAAADVAACHAHHAVSSRQWLQIAKDPDAHDGDCIIVYGQIQQFDSSTGADTFRADAGGAHTVPQFGFVDYPTNTVFEGSAATLSTFVEGDLFTAEVTVAGHVSYDNTLGGQTAAPLLRVDSITRTGHLSP